MSLFYGISKTTLRSRSDRVRGVRCRASVPIVVLNTVESVKNILYCLSGARLSSGILAPWNLIPLFKYFGSVSSSAPTEGGMATPAHAHSYNARQKKPPKNEKTIKKT